MRIPNNKNINDYGPNYKDLQLRKEKIKLQNFKDLLTGEKLDLEDVHYHHIDYDKNNDDPDNFACISINSHMRITNVQSRNPIEAEWYKKQLQENLMAIKEKRSPKTQKINKDSNINEYIIQLLWDDKKHSISSRIEKGLYESIKKNELKKTMNQLIQNFIRKFLRDNEFRKEFLTILYNQFDQDFSRTFLTKEMIEDTKTVSCKIITIEKKLFMLYFTFLCNFTSSYAIRTALIHFKEIEDQDPIKKEEISPKFP